jgi:hypothetical protein
MALLDAVTRFIEVFNSIEKNFGKLILLPEERAVPEALLPPGELRTFYARVDFEELITGTELFFQIATMAELPRYQEGWRWVYDTDPAGIEDTEHWNMNWLVFGDRNGEALFTKLQDEKSPVFGSLQKTRIYQLSKSLESFLSIIEACMKMERDEFQFDTQSEDCEVKPEFIERTRDIVSQYERPEITNQFIGFFFE